MNDIILKVKSILILQKKCKTLRTGVEPATFRLTAECSNQLSYRSFHNSLMTYYRSYFLNLYFFI